MLADRAGQVEVAATKSSPTDVVTEMDRRSEELIRSRILAARPADAILGEEGGLIGNTGDAPASLGHRPARRHRQLPVRPARLGGLDRGRGRMGRRRGGGRGGRRRGGGEVGGAEGGEVGRRIVAGAVYVPMRGELFCAVRGQGAWLQAGEDYWQPLHCGPGAPLDQALVGTGFGYRKERRKVQGEVVAALLPQMRDIRRIGVASVDLCAVAAGRLDGFYERGLNYWDWAAGALVADRGRGGRRRPQRRASLKLDGGGRRPRPVRPRYAYALAGALTRNATPDASSRRVDRAEARTRWVRGPCRRSDS